MQGFAVAVEFPRLLHVRELDLDVSVSEAADGGGADAACVLRAAGKAFGGAVDGVDIVVAIVKEIADLFPRAGLYLRVFAA